MPPTLKLPKRAFKIFFTATILAATLATTRGALIHRWSFSEASGTNLTDSAGTANGYIAVIGANTDYSRGAGYVRLAGGAWTEADFMQFPSNLVHSLTNVTVEVWATPRAAQNWSRIFDFGPGTGATQANDYYLSFCRGTSLAQQRMEHDPAPAWRVDTGLATTVSNQYHYVATWSKTGGPGGGGLAAWYRDGVLAGSTDTGTRSITNVNDTVMWLGRSQFTSDSSASADFNEVRIYSHAMGSNEINFSRVNGPDTYVAPPAQASGFTMATNPNVLLLSWTPGAGSSGSIVVMCAGQATSMQPNYGTSYSASTIFGNGANLGASNYVVFAGAGGNATVTNLQPGVKYYATVYSYSGSGAGAVLNLADAPSTNQTAPGTVQSIALTTSSQIIFGGTVQATVRASYSGGSVVDVTGGATYSSGAANVISVSASGVLTAQGIGTAWITAAFQGFLASNNVTVVNPLTNNLRHRYTFNTDASDLFGTANGTLSGGATIVSNQVIFNGTSAYVDLPNNLLTNYTSVTFETWVTDNGGGTWGRIYDFGNNNAGEDAQGAGLQYMFLSLPGGDGGLRGAFTTNSNAGEQILTATRPLVGNKTHIVWTSDAATTTSRLYINGTNVAVNTAATLTPAMIGPTVNDWLGKSVWPDPYFYGTMDEFRIYDVALPASLIQTNYLNGPNGLPSLPPVAVNDSGILNPGGKISLAVLANDNAGTAPVPATVEVVTPPVNGTAAVNTNTGKIFYSHDGSATLSDAFTYRVRNSLGQTSAVATVTLVITNALRLPNTTINVPNAPPPTSYQIVDAFPGVTFTQPLALRTPAGVAYSNLLFVCERRGLITYINTASANPVKQTFLNITNQVSFDNSATDGELGMLSIEFHPGFATNGIFFVYYIAPNGSVWYDRLSRFTADPFALTVNTNTQQMLFQMPDREFNHNGGDLHFGLDGYLYISMGDEGAQYNFHTNAQRLDGNLFSGILRIDVDKKAGNVEPTAHTGIPTDGSGHAFYSIPADNPFFGVTNLYGAAVNTNALRGEFYAIGFRHPWRFSIDPVSGEVWVGDVGQDKWEEVEVLRKGGNYGWPYYEGTHLTSTNYPTQSTMYTPPAGYVMDPPLYEYPHTGVLGATAQFSGLDVCGSLPYHGTAIPQLAGAYIFGDFDGAGNIWALHRTNSVVTVERLSGQVGLAAFGADPRNGDVLLCNYLQNKLQRLIHVDDTSSTFPAKLSDTGIYADLATLAPNPGEVNYDPIVTFWSDYAVKHRWFTIPDLTNQITFVADGNWTFPTGMKWIKHFDLELTRGNPAAKKRIETRVLVKNDTGTFGVSYAWNDAGTEAYLVPDGGTNFNLAVQAGTNSITQTWEIPSRSACLACHTAVAGHALSFNTRELNQTSTMNGLTGNQLALLSAAGYFTAPIAAPQTLPAFAALTNDACSLEFRVRSYLAENCVQCHQPGGAGAQTWDARPWLTLQMTRLINGTPDNNGGDPFNKLIVPGDTNHSVLLQRLVGTTFSRMPPLATHELDHGAIDLVTKWITTDLTNRLSFADWQVKWFGSTNNPLAAATADPDGDGANNYYEYLTQSSPLTNAPPPWTITMNRAAGTVGVSFLRVANLGFVVETSPDFKNWVPWDVPGNRLWYSATSYMDTITGPLTSETNRFYRVHIYEP